MIEGEVYGRLTAVKNTGKVNKHGYFIWLFSCSCGNTIECTGSEVWRKKRQSCGCLRKENCKTANLQHGLKNTRIYAIWNQIKQRCNNKKHIAYYRYGGRGIKICKRWLKVVNFFEDMGLPPSKEHTLDRIDNEKGYCKKNCRWATRKQQSRNSRGNVNYTHNGITKCLGEWAEFFNIPYALLWDRINKSGWSFDRAVSETMHIEKSRRKTWENVSI